MTKTPPLETFTMKIDSCMRSDNERRRKRWISSSLTRLNCAHSKRMIPNIRTCETSRCGVEKACERRCQLSGNNFGTSPPSVVLILLHCRWHCYRKKQPINEWMNERKFKRAQGNDIKWFHSSRNVLQILMNHIVVLPCNCVYTLAEHIQRAICSLLNDDCLRLFQFLFSRSKCYCWLTSSELDISFYYHLTKLI